MTLNRTIPASPVLPPTEPRKKRSRRLTGPLAFLTVLVLLLLSAMTALSIGQVHVPFRQVVDVLMDKLTGRDATGSGLDSTSALYTDVVWSIRLPRVLLGMVVGAGLATCGVVMQACLQNPLADPYLLGISAGGSLGATVAILAGFGSGGLALGLGLPLWAFLGSVLATLVVLLVGATGSRTSAVKLVLAGSAVNALCSAAASAVVYFAGSSEGIRSVTFWALGSLASADWSDLAPISAAVVAALVVFSTQLGNLDVMLTGDDAAITLGVDSARRRRIYLLLCALVTGTLVAECGVIGFVGLLVPHVVRSLVGSSHRRLLPIAASAGALFLIWADVIARVVVSNAELPIGIVTAVLGAPIFLHMLTRKEYRFG